MRIYNGEEYYTVTEVSQLIRENAGAIYYHIKKNDDFPKPTIIENIMHYNENDMKKIKGILSESTSKGGRKRERNYIPKQNNSYARLRVDYARLLKENEELKRKLEEVSK